MSADASGMLVQLHWRQYRIVNKYTYRLQSVRTEDPSQVSHPMQSQMLQLVQAINRQRPGATNSMSRAEKSDA